MRDYVLRKPCEDPGAVVPGCTAKPCAGTAASGPGLSKGHNLTTSSSLPNPPRPPFRIETWENAGLFRVVTPYQGVGLHQGSKRGEIKGYSSKAQARARAFLAKIPDSELLISLMVTLTYPGNDCAEAIPDAKEWQIYKNHLRRFGQELKRKWNASAVWVLEFQKRGAPHYHLIVFGVELARLVEFRTWVAEEWNRIVGGDFKHLQAGTQCDIAKSPHGARCYLVKYMTKGDQALKNISVGRYWGKVNQPEIPLAEEKVEEVTQRQAIIAARVARKWTAKQCGNSSWRRFHKLASKRHDCFGRMSLETFRAMCLHFQRGGIFFDYNNGFGEAFVSVLVLLCALSGDHVGKIRWPQKPRTRNNCTMNVFCHASAFRDALARHPGWTEAG